MPADPQTTVKASLDAELSRRLWALFDAAKALAEEDSPERWVAFYRAVADVPEGQRP